MNEHEMPPKDQNRRVHMANERTFLAWIRTSIGIIALGFVIEKFALFIKQMSYIMGNVKVDYASIPSHKHSAILGILLVGFGALIALFAYFRYRNVRKQIDEDTYKPSGVLDLILTIAVLATGIFLCIYLIQGV